MVAISGYSDWNDEQLKEFIDRKIYVIYPDINGNYCEATINSSFSHDVESVQAIGEYGVTLFSTPVSHIYKIDDNCVDCNTFIKVTSLLKNIDDIKNKDKHSNTIGGIYDDMIWFDIETKRVIYNKTQEKENKDMPKIVNYKYNEETGTTTLFWADKTQTTVTADNLTEANQFEGFCAACAKKLFGNRSTYLNQFDKWTVKIPERERLAAEKKVKEDKERKETKARKAAKKAERRAKREVELLAKEFSDNYKHESVWEQAKKLAMKKYGVPADYFLDKRCNCHYGCKEFDITDETDISD